MDFRSEIAEELSSFRLQRKMSQEAMAELCHLTPRYYNDLENKKANPTLATLCKIAEGTGIALNVLANAAGIEKATTDAEIYYLAVENKKKTYDLVCYDKAGKEIAREEDVSGNFKYIDNAAKVFTANKLLPELMHEVVSILLGILI